jgi:hypothetical protein
LDDILDSADIENDDTLSIDDSEDINLADEDISFDENDDIDLNLDEENEEESIGLSDNELDDILDSAEIDTEESVSLSSNELDNILDTTELIEIGDVSPTEIAEEINNSDLQQLTPSKEDDIAIYSSLKAEMQAKEAKEAEEKTELLKKDVKTVLSYLDQLLDALPEEKIKEFAESKEFDIYKKLFEELNIKIN